MLEISHHKHVATVKLNRPEKNNAFDDKLIAKLTGAFQTIDQDDAIKVMVLAAKGKHFSAGGDLSWMKRMANYSREENLEDAKKLASMLAVLNSMSKPTIARVQGAVYGGAVGLVSCCDLVVASDDAKFCLSEVKIGLIPATISPYVIAAIGQRQTRRYALTAEVFDATRAHEMGLVSEVCDVNELDEVVHTFIKQCLNNSPQALSKTKELLRKVAQLPLSEELSEMTSQQIADIRVSSEGQEGLTAFLEKRQPSWIKSDNKNKSNEED